jgi:beta-N-acetylhexosaminidase
VDAGDPGTNFFRLLQAADSADVVIVSSYVATVWNASTIAAPRDFTTFIHRLVVQGHRPIVIALGNPYLLHEIPEVPAYLVAWGGFPVSQRAAARAVLGVIPITGHLPIGIPPVAPLGAGEQRPARSALGTGAR